MPSGTLMRARAESDTERGLELTVQLFHRPQTLDRPDKCDAIGVDPGGTIEVCVHTSSNAARSLSHSFLPRRRWHSGWPGSRAAKHC